jgi:tetratricopeptide (TPR) repeat protein
MDKPESTLLPSDWDVPAKLRARLGNTAGRQRLLEGEGHLILVLHAPPGADETGRRGRFFWRAPDGTWRAAPKAERVANIEAQLNEYRTAIEQLERAEDEAQNARDYFELLDRLAPLTRSARNMYETLQQAREAMPNDRQLIVARDQAYEITRRADLLYADAKNALDFAVAWQAEQQAESSHQMAIATHRLNMLVAFFFPIATLSTIFGVELRNGLERWDTASVPLPFLAILAVGLCCGIFLTGFIARPAGRPKRGIQDSAKLRPRGSK